MGVLRPNDPPFSGLPLRFDSALPPSGVLEGQISPLFASLREADLGALLIENGTSLAAQLSRQIAGGVGWPDSELDALGSLVSTAFERVAPADVAKVLASAALVLPDALLEIQTAVTDTISGIPILGWIVKLGALVWRLVDAARARAPKIASAQALGYDRDDDSFASDGLIVRAGDRDWTALFLPPSGGFSDLPLAYTASGLADGFAWGQLAVVSERMGLVPGVGQICGYWQSPRRLSGSSRDAGRESIVAGNELYPSATSFAALLWSNAQLAGGATLGAIDLDRVADAWREYGERLQAFASSTGGWLGEQIRNGWRWYDPTSRQPYYGADPKDAPKKYRGEGLDDLIAWRVERARERVRRGLDTISVAYLGPNTPALRDSALREVWEKRRQQLLTHDARRLVDLALIPDADYRSALAAARRSASNDLAAPTAPKPKPPQRVPPGTVDVPTIDGDGPPPAPEPPSLPGVPEAPGASSSGGATGGVLAAILLYLALQGRRR